MIVLDTSVMSAVLRRKRRGPAEENVARRIANLLASDEDVVLPGIVFQEILSGVADPAQLAKLMRSIRESFPVILASEGDHLMAADLATQAARRGVALATPDALIAAQALNRRAVLYTLDSDFADLANHAALRLLAES